ncbi:MAG TPA: sugar phosphorylase, partial [bacterium]|nr:sugar phosphorylase [bacterium]
LNISYFNALSDEDEDEEIKIKKFINTYGIILVLQGVPGIYIHSILGSENYYDGVKTTGQNRSINREKFDYERIREELKDIDSRRYRIYSSFIKLLDTRKNSRVFSPNSEQEILELDNRVIAISRKYQDEKLLAIHNITPGSVSLKIDIGDLDLDPYEFVWLRYSSE